jgi:phage gp29-like protein
MAILDAYGRPINYEMLTEEQAAPTFIGIRNIYSSIDSSIGLTPEKVIGVLRQAEFGDPWLYLELAERMEEKDELYQGVLHTRKMAVSQLNISIVAASDASSDQDDAAFIEEVLLQGDLDLHDCIFDILDALGKGFSATEIIWDIGGRNAKTGRPQWIPRALKSRDPRWFMFDWITGEQLLVRSMRPEGQALGDGQPLLNPVNLRILGSGYSDHQVGLQPATEPLAPFKFITHITKAKAGLPIRGGLARVAMWNYLFRNYILKDFVVFCEVFGQPLRVGKYGPGATEADKGLLLQAVANIGTDAAAIIPESMSIEFEKVAQAGDSTRVYKEALEYLDPRLTIAVLGQELTTSIPKGGGSRAAAEVHDVVRRDIATDDARRLSATLNRDLVKPLIDLNRGPRVRYPKIKFGFEDEEGLEQLASALGAFVDRGLPVSQQAILAKFGLRAPGRDEAILHPVKEPASDAGATDPSGDAVHRNQR